MHVGDGCACTSPPETQTVCGEGVDKDCRVYCREHLPSNVDTASREPSFRRVAGVVNALLAEQVSVLQYFMCW